jgi:acetylornithine deacetylase/succinyl-diaminopimelate desuccinylase-like protein
MTSIPALSSELVAAASNSVSQRFPSAISKLTQLVKIEGIAWEAFDAENLELSAKAVKDLFDSTGLFDWIEIRRAEIAKGTMGAPAVIGRREAKNGKPQILLYAHHDVQPPGDSTIWQTPAFQPTIKNGRLYGRGAADDKAGIVAHLTALEVLCELTGANPDVGITLFVEGEEEAGSPSFKNFLEANKHDLESDVIIVADSGNWTTEIPALTTTLRGLVSLVLEVKTLDHAVHSGMFGGAVPDAMTVMLRLLASLHDEAGNVAVSGLVSSKASDLPYDEAQLREDSGLLPSVSQLGDGTILDRSWTKPSITVIGIDYPSIAVSSNTLLPSVKAKISMRIAPGQLPEEALELLKQHLTRRIAFGAQLEFGDVELGKPFASDSAGWAKTAMEQALDAGFGRKSVDIGIGGSIPFIADLLEVFPAAQILVTGVEDPDSRAHSPNESVPLESLRKAMTSEALFLLNGNEITQ